MRALVFDQHLSFQPNHPDPPPREGDSLIRVRRAGVCSTDLEICKGYMNFSGILGHEFVGEVLDSPDKTLVGKRVAGEINAACNHCDMCRAQLPTHCRNRTVLGILNHGGAFADHLRLPAQNLHLLHDNIDDDQAVFIEPLAAAFQILKQVKIDPTTRVTVLGDGRLGLLVSQVIKTTGANLTVIGKHPEKLALCRKWSIATRLLPDVTPNHDQDIVIDCTGSAAGFDLAMSLVRPRGTIVLKSTVAAGQPLNLAPIVIDELTIIGSRCGPFPDAIRALADHSIDVTSLIHKRMKLDQGVEALDIAARPGVLKVILTMD